MADKERKLIEQYCREGETPWFVITTGANGLLAAFEDRLIIAKTGVIAGYCRRPRRWVRDHVSVTADHQH
jgi:hypothetical protein